MLKQLIDKIKKFEKILSKFPELKYAGDPVLRQAAEAVSIEEGIRIGKKLGEVLIRYRKEVGYGRGFAAPQIGENKAVFVAYVYNKLQIFINPKITNKSKETNFYREICLSSGVMSVDIERSDWVVMEWLDVKGEKHNEKFDGFLARLYQHEEAHLRGKLNLDEATEGGIGFALFDPLKEQLRKSK
jgi:peptide deformylase